VTGFAEVTICGSGVAQLASKLAQISARVVFIEGMLLRSNETKMSHAAESAAGCR